MFYASMHTVLIVGNIMLGRNWGKGRYFLLVCINVPIVLYCFMLLWRSLCLNFFNSIVKFYVSIILIQINLLATVQVRKNNVIYFVKEANRNMMSAFNVNVDKYIASSAENKRIILPLVKMLLNGRNY